LILKAAKVHDGCWPSGNQIDPLCAPFLLMEASVLIIDQVRWQAMANISRFREFLYPPDDFQRRQLQKLRGREGKWSKAPSFPPKSSKKSWI